MAAGGKRSRRRCRWLVSLPAWAETCGLPQGGFSSGLSDAGFVEGRNLAIEYRFAENQQDRLPGLATELVDRKVTVIAATGGGNRCWPRRLPTTTIPIVFTTAVILSNRATASLNRPGGNATGVNLFNAVLSGKTLGLLHELVPDASLSPFCRTQLPEASRTLSDAQEAARTLGRMLVPMLARGAR